MCNGIVIVIVKHGGRIPWLPSTPVVMEHDNNRTEESTAALNITYSKIHVHTQSGRRGPLQCLHLHACLASGAHRAVHIHALAAWHLLYSVRCNSFYGGGAPVYSL